MHPRMSNVKGRSRRAKAAATRRRIVRAAHDEFVAHGYHGATIASIADRAGVAAQTVYFVFHTKAALIEAVIETAVMGEDEPVVPQDTQWWADMRAAPSASAAISAFVRGAAPLFARAAKVSEILRAAALTDDEVARVHVAQEDLRHSGFREVVEVVASKGRLGGDLTVDTATDVLMTLFGDSTYVLMTRERGWAHEVWIEWLCGALPVVLLDRP